MKSKGKGGGMFLAALQQKNEEKSLRKESRASNSNRETPTETTQPLSSSFLSTLQKKKSSVGVSRMEKDELSLPSTPSPPPNNNNNELEDNADDDNSIPIPTLMSKTSILISSVIMEEVESSNGMLSQQFQQQQQHVQVHHKRLDEQQQHHKSTSKSLGALEPAVDHHVSSLNHAQSMGGRARSPSSSTSTADLFGRGRSTTGGGGGEIGFRDRSASQTSVDAMYGRAGKSAPKFEMENPMLGNSKISAEWSHTLSHKEAETERIKMDSLLHSASHVDQLVFLERRNTRRASVDVRSSAAAVVVSITQDAQVEE